MPRTKTMLDHALGYAKAGLPVLPLHGILEDGSCTCDDANCKSPGKHPRTKTGLKEATTDARTIRKWWGKNRWPNASIGGVGGTFLCLDVDVKSGGVRSLQRLVQANAPLPATAVAETGEYEIEGAFERGQHYWFKMPKDAPAVSSRANVRPGIDIRCHNGYAVLPPSPHVSGVDYEWMSGSIKEAEEVPEWVTELAPEVVEGDSTWEPDPNFKMSREVRDFLRGKHEVDPGEQRDFLTRAARSVLTTGKSVERAAELLWEGYDGNGGLCSCEWGEDPWFDSEVLSIVSDIYLKGPSSPMEKDFSPTDILETDKGNAKRLISSYEEGHVFYVPDWGKWYVWDDTAKRFYEDSGSRVRVKFADEVTKAMMVEAAERHSEDESKRLFSHAVRSQNKPRIDAAVVVAKDYVGVESADLNADPMLFGVANGVVDLRTGELLDPDPKYRITKRAYVEYEPDAQSNVWDEFLEQVVPDEDLREFLQRAFGYTLTGDVSEHKFFYLHGPPASGKSTLLEALAYLMGRYAESADPTTFMHNPNRSANGPSEDLARLANARMVVTHEIEKGSRWADGHLSRLTGGDTVTARFSYQPTFKFKPQFKLWFSANHKPRIPSTQSGLWRRILVVPMEVVIPQNERNPQLPRALRRPEVQSAILAWALEGVRAWREQHEAEHEMVVPEIVLDEIEAYRVEEDELSGFIADCVEKLEGTPLPPPSMRVSTKAMFERYTEWAREVEGKKIPLPRNRFSQEMKARGFETRQMVFEGGQKLDGWEGVRLRKKGKITTPQDRKRR